MATKTATVQADALDELGTIYRNTEGHEVWEIRDRSGAVIYTNVVSDHDAAWLANQVAA